MGEKKETNRQTWEDNVKCAKEVITEQSPFTLARAATVMGPGLNFQETNEKRESFICLQQEDQSERKNAFCQQRFLCCSYFAFVVFFFYVTNTWVGQEKEKTRKECGQWRLTQRLINNPQFLETPLKGKQVQSRPSTDCKFMVFFFVFNKTNRPFGKFRKKCTQSLVYQFFIM